VIGKPHLHPVLRSFLEDKNFITSEHGNIKNQQPRPGEQAAYTGAETRGTGEKHALITRVPGPRPDRHLLLLSGSGAEQVWALAESITSAEHVAEIFSHVRGEGDVLPESFQVVIGITFRSNVPVKIRYVTHR
jgi:hypothetical protein